jgi:hypothetical protein
MAHVLDVKEPPLEVATQQANTEQPLCSTAHSLCHQTTFGQTRKAMHNVTLRRVRAIIVVVDTL